MGERAQQLLVLLDSKQYPLPNFLHFLPNSPRERAIESDKSEHRFVFVVMIELIFVQKDAAEDSILGPEDDTNPVKHPLTKLPVLPTGQMNQECSLKMDCASLLPGHTPPPVCDP